MPHAVTLGSWPLIAQCCSPTLLPSTLPRAPRWYPHCKELPHTILVLSAGKHERYNFAFDPEKPACHYAYLEMASCVSKILLSDLVLLFETRTFHMKLWEFVAFPLHLGLTVPCNSATRANKRLQLFIFSHYSDKPGIRHHQKWPFYQLASTSKC